MQIRYTVRQEPDSRFSVVVEETGVPVRLRGIPQTGLRVEDAEALVDRLMAMAERIPEPTQH